MMAVLQCMKFTVESGEILGPMKTNPNPNTANQKMLFYIKRWLIFPFNEKNKFLCQFYTFFGPFLMMGP